MIKEKILNLISRMFNYESDPCLLAFTVSLSVYIALCPFVFLHTIMVLTAAWFFSLNSVFMLIITNTINNPWTMLFIYTSGYSFGNLILHTILGYRPMALNPAWMEPLNNTLHSMTGMSGIALWSFLIGGNLLAILFSVILYPIIKYMCTKVIVNNK